MSYTVKKNNILLVKDNISLKNEIIIFRPVYVLMKCTVNRNIFFFALLWYRVWSCYDCRVHCNLSGKDHEMSDQFIFHVYAAIWQYIKNDFQPWMSSKLFTSPYKRLEFFTFNCREIVLKFSQPCVVKQRPHQIFLSMLKPSFHSLSSLSQHAEPRQSWYHKKLSWMLWSIHESTYGLAASMLSNLCTGEII